MSTTSLSNRFAVWLYRKTDGRGFGKDARVLMLSTPGRRSGLPHSTCVQYVRTDEGYLVWATGSGSRHVPDWFRNLRACDSTQVQVRKEHLTARPRELVGEERDEVWRNVILAATPKVQKFADKAGRTIPVAVLVPVAG